MWSKISNALKPRYGQEEQPDQTNLQSSQSEVMSKVFEQHPNLSVFHSSSDLPIPHPSPPSSPSRHGRRGMFKRLSKVPPREDTESLRAPSPMRLPIGLPKKVKSSLHLNGNNSQHSLSRVSTETTRPGHDIGQRSSQDMLRSANDSTRRSSDTSRSGETLRRPSLDMLRMNGDTSRPSPTSSHSPHPSEDGSARTPITPLHDPKFGSVRSILRDPKTPGTGQNVRFFSRDAYKVISPDQSMDTEFQALPQSTQNPVQSNQESFLDRLSRSSPEVTGTAPAAMTRAATHTKTSRPTVAEVFSPLSEGESAHTAPDQSDFLGPTNFKPVPPPDFSNLFDMSQGLELPTVPPGLGFEVAEPVLDSALDLGLSRTDDGHENPEGALAVMTSTPYRDKGKGKAKDKVVEDEKENVPLPIDESIFHAHEKSPRLPSILHDRSQSFSFGQTVFHSIINGSGSATSSPNTSGVFASSDLKPSLFDRETDAPFRASSPLVSKSRSRAMSDTAFMSMMRSSPKPPESDINDESSADLVVYSGGAPEPDPFSANANTYYTPQTMIPVTPPQGVPTHTRRTSKEENIIFSLQTQLALQTELCGQYESDLRARDELVEILGKKLTDLEKDESKRRSVLRSWKKKVQELEKTCRYLEEEVEGSRHDSMERSIMDEASGEALRMLHRQIAVLEKEKSEWTRKEDALREEVETLEVLVKERSEDIMNLKEALWHRDESERELKEGIRDAKEQMEMMGNVSLGMVDEEELKKLVMEKGEQERERHRAAEFGWEEERAELLAKMDDTEAENVKLKDELETVNQQLTTRDQEYTLLKAELEAQWGHTEKATEKIEGLGKQLDEVQKERDELKLGVEELEQKIANMELEWNESENKKAELESEVQELWNYKEELEKEREQFEDQLQQEREHSEDLTRALQEREDRISELEQERQFALDNVTRLEGKLHQHDQEISEYSERVVQREAEAEQLREEMSRLRREHSHVTDEQSRALQEISLQQGETKAQMEGLIRQKAETDVEIKTSKDRVNALKEEIERLRRQVHELQQESADKEVKLVQVTKQRNQAQEDKQGLNIALDSKQQELELLKRRNGVRGTAGATPSQPARTTRRDSTVFNTPVISRPSSVMSDTGSTLTKERKSSLEALTTSAAKTPALGRSVRANSTSNNPVASASKPSTKGIEGSMGPPPLKPRASVAGTPTPATRVSSLTRPNSTKPPAQLGTPVPHRRVPSLERPPSVTKVARKPVSASSPPSASISEQDEKENIDLGSRRRSMLPIPA